MPAPNPPAGGLDTREPMNIQLLVNAAQDTVKAIYALKQTIETVFPQGTGISGTAGVATGTYLTVVGPDGNPYKIALLNP